MRRASRHGVRKTGDFRAHLEQPRRQPRTLESGVPGDEHPAAFIDMTKHRLSLGENASGGQRASALWAPVRGNHSPRAPSTPPYPAQACACTGYGGSVGVGHPFSGCRNGAAGKLFFKERRIAECPTHNPPHLQKSWEGEGWGCGGRGGKPFSRRVPSPSPAYQNAICTTGRCPCPRGS